MRSWRPRNHDPRISRPHGGELFLAVAVGAFATLTIAIGFGAKTRTNAFAALAFARQAFYWCLVVRAVPLIRVRFVFRGH